MDWLSRVFRRLRLVARGDAADALMDAEMRYHIECETAERVRGGMTPDDARRAALRDFGGVERYKEEGRDARGDRAFADVRRDLRFAARVLRRNPSFTIPAALTFALGIGVATAIFTVVDAVLLRPLPYADPGRLAVVWERELTQATHNNVVAVGNFEAWRDRNRSFSSMAGIVPAPVTLIGNGPPERVRGAEVSASYFQLLGVHPALGRDFSPDDVRSSANVVMLSDGLWRRRFGGDPAVIGRSIDIGGRAHTVVGVMRPDFDAPRFFWLGHQELWLPFVPTESNRSWGRFLIVIGRLRPGVTIGQAQADLSALASRLAKEVRSDDGWTATAVPLEQEITGEVRRPLLVLLGAVGLLLAMAVTNVAALSLALARRRERELDVRRAMGATRGRLLQQLFTQSLMLGAVGAVIGVVAAVVGVQVLTLLMPPDLPRSMNVEVNGSVLLFGVCVSALASVVFGSVAAFRASVPRATAVAHRSDLSSRSTPRLRGGALVSAEIALGLVLTIVAALMLRSVGALRSVDLGFRADSVVVARISLSGDRYAVAGSERVFFNALLERVRALPGVNAAGVVSTRPFGGEGPATTARDAGRGIAPGEKPPVADIRYTDAGFFSAMRIPVRAGSAFSGDAPTNGEPRAVISQTLATLLWPGRPAVGKRLAVELFNGITARVVGVVADVHLMDARTLPRPAVYLETSRFPTGVADLVIRSDGDVEPRLKDVRRELAALDPGIPLYQSAAFRSVVDESLARDRFVTVLLGSFALVALALAAVGIYGVFSSSVSRRRKEIGIRIALGARPSGVIALVVRQIIPRAAIGIAIGVAAAAVLTRAMGSMLYGVGPGDPSTFVGVTVLLAAVAAGATFIPARRAARASPLEAIRTDG